MDVSALKQTVGNTQVGEIVAAFAGGTVGVMGSLTAFEKRMHELKERQRCCYCRGAGILPCGTCFTAGVVPNANVDIGRVSCDECAAGGYVLCNHCEGSGEALPAEYRVRSRFVLPDDDMYYTDKHWPIL